MGLLGELGLWDFAKEWRSLKKFIQKSLRISSKNLTKNWWIGSIHILRNVRFSLIFGPSPFVTEIRIYSTLPAFPLIWILKIDPQWSTVPVKDFNAWAGNEPQSKKILINQQNQKNSKITCQKSIKIQKIYFKFVLTHTVQILFDFIS